MAGSLTFCATEVFTAMISVIIAPPNAWRPPVAVPQKAPPPRLEQLDLELVDTLRRHGQYGTLVWPLLNEVAAEQHPKDRAEARQIRLELWGRLRRLIKAGLVFRYTRRSISVHNLPRHTVNRRRRSRAGSTLTARPASEPRRNDNMFGKSSITKAFPQYAAPATPSSSTVQAKSAPEVPLDPLVHTFVPVPTNPVAAPAPNKEQAEKIRQAACELARLPRKVKKRWTGYVRGTRMWRGRKILLPDGRLTYCYGVLRGQLIWTSWLTGTAACADDEKWSWGIVNANDVSIVKNANAVALGKLKAGVRERKSEAKARAARNNGLLAHRD